MTEAPPKSRDARAWLVVNGVSILVEQASAHVHRFQSPDTFSATVGLDFLPAGTDAAYFASASPIQASIEATNDERTGDRVTLVAGSIETVDIAWDTRTLSVTGRDQTAGMLDKQTSENFTDQTPIDVITTIAGRHGLTVSTDGAFTSKAGKQYTDQHDEITDLETEWDTVVRMAERMGKIAYVKGNTLFLASPSGGSQSGNVLSVEYSPSTPQASAVGRHFETLRTKRNVPLAGSITVNVRSYDRKQKKVITGQKTLGGSGPQLEYNYNEPGITKDDADSIAEKRALETGAHEMTVEMSAPGDVTVDPQMTLVISGTGTNFDQAYQIDSVLHDFGEGGGYTMQVEAKNHDEGRSVG